MNQIIISHDKKIEYISSHAPYSLREIDISKLGTNVLIRPEVENYLQRLSIYEINKILEIAPKQINDIENTLTPPESDELKESEKNSIFKMFAAMVYALLKHEPSDKKSSTSGKLAKLVTAHIGENIDPDTVRRWLKTICERFPRKSSTT